MHTYKYHDLKNVYYMLHSASKLNKVALCMGGGGSTFSVDTGRFLNEIHHRMYNYYYATTAMSFVKRT